MHDAPAGGSPSDQLTAAARQLIAATRNFLDVVESTLDDPERINTAVVGVAGVVRDTVSGLSDNLNGLSDSVTGRAEPWVRAASQDDAGTHRANEADDADLIEAWSVPEGPSRVRRVSLD